MIKYSLWFHPLLIDYVPNTLAFQTDFDDAFGIISDDINDNNEKVIYQLIQFLISVELPIMIISFDYVKMKRIVYHYRFHGESIINDLSNYLTLNAKEKEILKFYEFMRAV